jgi:carbon-monoxide dehydrogenase medium subunit
MKPSVFDYFVPTSVTDAISLLVEHCGEAKLLAGGQSLVPMLNFRVLNPQALIDINRISELDFVSEGEESIRVGALTRHRVIETSPLIAKHFPILPAVMKHVAHLAIRNRGTIGGSFAHADPAAELALMGRLLGAKILTRSPSGERSIEASDFFVSAMTTVLEEAELLCEVEFPYLPENTFWGFEEFSLRSGDVAIAAAAVTVTLSDGRCEQCRIAVIGGETAIRIPQAEGLLNGNKLSQDAIAAAAKTAGEAAPWNVDQHASSELRHQLVEVLTQRALVKAWQRSEGQS